MSLCKLAESAPKILLSVSNRPPSETDIQAGPLKIFKMRHFTVNLVVNIIGAILFLIMGIALIVGFVLNQSIVEELQQVKIIVLLLLVFLMILLVMMMQAANFDNWQPFILISGILALFTAVVFILGSWKVINMVAILICESVNVW